MIKQILRRLATLSPKINLPVSDGSGPTPVPVYTPSSVRTGVLALKKGMTTIWDEYGVQTPVTVLQLKQVQVLKSLFNKQSNTYKVQICAVDAKRSSRVLRNQFLKYHIKPKRYIREFRVSPDACLPPGLTIRASHFVPGQYIDVRAKTVGKGFQGVMKRHGFKGGRATHGNSLSHRSLGSTGGCQDPGKVWKGKKMPGQMGNVYRTVQSLKVVKVDCLYDLIYVKGSVPGMGLLILGVDDALVECRDAVRKRWIKEIFPKDSKVPFPTMMEEIAERELVEEVEIGTDPFAKTRREKI